MASPVADAYNAPSGADVYAGRYPGSSVLAGGATLTDVSAAGDMVGAVPNDVVANVWTPTKDGSGNILAGSWANLPLNEWCKVAGTKVQQLQDQLNTAGLGGADLGAGGSTTGILGTFNAWNGVAVDQAAGKVYSLFNGGHNDSSLNCGIRLDLERMGSDAGWVMARNPSNPNDATYPWSTAYKTSGSFTQYTPPLDTPADILPDGTGTSRHTYGGVWYDTTRGLVGLSRVSRWTWEPTTNAVTRQKFYDGATLLEPTIGHLLHYDAVTDRVIGVFSRNDYDYYRFSKHDPSTAGQVVDIGMPFGFAGSGSSCVIDRKILVLCSESDFHVDHWGLYDIDAGTWTHADISSGALTYGYAHEMMVCCYVPELGKVIRRGTYSPLLGNWYQFDPVTKAQTTWSPGGLSVPFSPWPGNKCFYYTARKTVVYITPSAMDADAIYVMRTG